MTYGVETGTLTNKEGRKYIHLKITYRDRKANIWVRENTKDIYVIEQEVVIEVRSQKWIWACDRISEITVGYSNTTWKPNEEKRSRGRPMGRRRDELDEYWKDTIR